MAEGPDRHRGMLMSPLPEGRVLVAASGGPDSTALLLALHESDRDVVAAHFDHALGAGSEVPARRVAELCARLHVPLICERRNEPLPGRSLQAAARTLRYAFLDRARLEAGADLVVLAHTADDLVEGVVLHLMRGCGLPGFRGMPARRGPYMRPMLQAWRSEVLAYLEQRGVVTYQDPANRDPRFARVRVRTEILPQLERDRPGITARFHAAAMAAGRRHEQAEEAASGLLTRSRLRSLPQPAAAAALRRLYIDAGGPEPGLSRSHLHAMLRLAGPGPGGRGVDLPGALRFRIVGDHMEVVPAQRAALGLPDIEVKACAGCDDPSAAHLRAGSHLRIGFRRPGLRMRPLGGRGTRKLQDIFVDARVPREDRDEWPLVFADGRLAWVPGIAVDAELVVGPGEEGQHVSIPFSRVLSGRKLARLETPFSPRGDLS